MESGELYYHGTCTLLFSYHDGCVPVVMNSDFFCAVHGLQTVTYYFAGDRVTDSSLIHYVQLTDPTHDCVCHDHAIVIFDVYDDGCPISSDFSCNVHDLYVPVTLHQLKDDQLTVIDVVYWHRHVTDCADGGCVISMI
jgi:hypothetical protein